MKHKYLLDSNILIDYFRGFKPVVDFINQLFESDNINIAISGITELEIYAGKTMDKPNVQQKVVKFISQLIVFLISRELLQQSGQLCRKTNIQPVDAIIAMTTIKNNYVLITRNLKHFQGIANLKVFSP